MLKGTIYATNNMQILQNALGSSSVIIVGEADDNFINSINAVKGSVLMPPYQCVSALMDNRIEEYNRLYFQHLSEPCCVELIAVIIRSLYNGNNIMIYMNPDEYNMYFAQLSQYLLNTFGIMIGTESNNFGYNNNYDYALCTLLYQFNLFSPQEVLTLYPQGVQLTEPIIMKLITDINPFIEGADFSSYSLYFNNYKEKIKMNNNIFLKPSLRRKCNI